MYIFNSKYKSFVILVKLYLRFSLSVEVFMYLRDIVVINVIDCDHVIHNC